VQFTITRALTIYLSELFPKVMVKHGQQLASD